MDCIILCYLGSKYANLVKHSNCVHGEVIVILLAFATHSSGSVCTKPAQDLHIVALFFTL